MGWVLLALGLAQDEVTIVGRRVPESLRDEPVTGTVLDAPELERRRVATIQDLTRSVPGFTVTESGSRPFGDVFSMRGLVNTPFFSNASAAFYVDDIPFGDAYTYVHPLDLAERVEVLRGPRHTMFGRYAYGGAINVTSRRPGERPWSTLRTELASHDTAAANFALGTPLIPKTLALRIGGGRAIGGGFIDNTFLGVDSDDEERYGGNLALFWAPGERWDVGITVAGDRYDDGAPRFSSLSAPDPYEVASDVRGRLRLETDMQALRIGYRGEGFEALAVTARRLWDAERFEFDLDFTPQPGNRILFGQEQEILSQELRVRGASTSFEWVAGLYGHRKTTEHDGLREFNLPPPFFQESEATRFHAAEETWAAFGQVAVRVVEDARVHLGLRYDRARESMDRRKSSLLFPVPPPLDLNESFSKTTGRAGVDVHVAERALLYAHAAVAFKPGGFTGFSDLSPEFDSETARTVEVGAKTEFAEGRARIDGAAFYYWIDDYQVERSIPASTNIAVFNADEATSYGFEVEASVKPLDAVRLFAAAGWTRAVFQDYTDPVTGADLDGKRVPSVPSYNAWAGGEADLPGGFTARVEFMGKGEVFFDDANTPAFREGAYGIWNASLAWRWERVLITALCTNIGDEFYWTSMTTGIGAGSPSPDRVFGLRVRIDF